MDARYCKNMKTKWPVWRHRRVTKFVAMRRMPFVCAFFIACASPIPVSTIDTAFAQHRATPPATVASHKRVITITYLKSEPGQLAALERYVRANWFAMDAIAVQQGLLLDYKWLDKGADDGAWNAAVVVTYRDEKGFGGISDRWAAIKSAHREVLPDGRGMKELGRVVETHELFEDVG